MNFKKFISVVSAFAIASSMAVVANAAYSQDAIYNGLKKIHDRKTYQCTLAQKNDILK